MRPIINFCLLGLLGYSCSYAPQAEPIDLPAAVLNDATREASNNPQFVIDETIPAEWWALFNDEQLSNFIHTGLVNNPTLQSARAKILLAQTSADRVRAALFPNLVWGGDVSRQKLSETGLIPFNTNPMPGAPPLPVTAGQNGIPVYFTQYETELILTYDFDLWGKNRDTLRAAIGEVNAKIADEAFVRLQLSIAIAQIYFRLQVDYKRLEIAQAFLNNQSEYLVLISKRVAGNLSNDSAVRTTQTNISSAKQSIFQLQSDIAINEYQLQAYLADNFEVPICEVKIHPQTIPKVPLPCNLPMHLLAHRPDIQAQLWLIQSAGKQIDVAKAGFYPDFNLTAIFGYQTLHLHELFKYPSTYYNIDPAFTLPIFDGGRLIANLNTAEINYNLAIYQYNDLILNAAKEVLGGMAVLRIADKMDQESKNKLDYQKDLFNLTRAKFNHNINSGLDYLTSEQNVLLAQDQELVSTGNKLQAVLSLIKALGGGYNTCNEKG